MSPRGILHLDSVFDVFLNFLLVHCSMGERGRLGGQGNYILNI